MNKNDNLFDDIPSKKTKSDDIFGSQDVTDNDIILAELGLVPEKFEQFKKEHPDKNVIYQGKIVSFALLWYIKNANEKERKAINTKKLTDSQIKAIKLNIPKPIEAQKTDSKIEVISMDINTINIKDIHEGNEYFVHYDKNESCYTCNRKEYGSGQTGGCVICDKMMTLQEFEDFKKKYSREVPKSDELFEKPLPEVKEVQDKKKGATWKATTQVYPKKESGTVAEYIERNGQLRREKEDLIKKNTKLQEERDQLKEKAQKVIEGVETMKYNQKTFEYLKSLYTLMTEKMTFINGSISNEDLDKIKEIEEVLNK